MIELRTIKFRELYLLVKINTYGEPLPPALNIEVMEMTQGKKEAETHLKMYKGLQEVVKKHYNKIVKGVK